MRPIVGLTVVLMLLTGCAWASPVSPDTFGKLMNLLEVSDGEKTVYGGVQD
jgi:hypothetical protein